MKRIRGAGGDPLASAASSAKSEAARNGLVVAVLFGAFLCLIVFISMMIGSVGLGGSGATGNGVNGIRPPPAIDLNDETINHLTGQAAFSGRESPALCNGKIRFTRAHIAGPCEGYFDVVKEKDNTTSDADDADHHPRELPLPSRRRFGFCGMDEWARRLHAIEKAAIRDESGEVPSTGIQVHRQRGLAVSRITGKFLGNKEFTDWLSFSDKHMEDHPNLLKEHGGPGKVYLLRGVDDGSTPPQRATADKTLREAEYLRRIQSKLGGGDFVCWTGDLREHYILGFNVVPSEEFYHYVLEKYDQLEGNVHR